MRRILHFRLALENALLASLLATLCTPRSVAAHGGFWRANQVVVDTQSAQLYLRSDVRGLIVQSASGPAWLCAEAYGHNSLSAGRVRIALDARGALLVAGLNSGLHLSSDDLCTFRSAEGLTDFAVSDVTRHRALALALATPKSGEPRDGRVFAAEAGGAFAPLGEPLPRDFFPLSLRAVPTSGALIVGGLDARGALALVRADERGAGWTAGATLDVDPKRAWSFELLEVDERGETLIVLADELERSAGASTDRIYVSSDGGATLSPLFADGTPLHGFARSPDGKTILIASAAGLHRASFEEALAEREQAFEQVLAQPVYGLSWSTAGLYAGREEFLVGDSDMTSLSVSHDEGRTFAPVFALCGVRALACAPSTSVGARCAEVYSDMGLSGGGFYEDFLAPERCGGDAGSGERDASVIDARVAPDAADAGARVDAGRMAEDADLSSAPRASSGCTASPLVGAAPKARAAWLVWFVATALVLRRCRAHRHSDSRRSRD